MSIWCVLDDAGKIVDRFNCEVAPDIPHPAYPTYQIVQGTGSELIGWTYVNGIFEAPVYSETSVDPSVTRLPSASPVATVSDLQAQLHAIQAQLTALLASATPEPVVGSVVGSVVEPVVEPTVEPATDQTVSSQ